MNRYSLRYEQKRDSDTKQIGHQEVSCVALVATNLFKTLDAYCMLLLVWKHLHTLMQECVCMHVSMCMRVQTYSVTKRKSQMCLRPIDHYHPSKPISLCFCACVWCGARKQMCLSVCVYLHVRAHLSVSLS